MTPLLRAAVFPVELLISVGFYDSSIFILFHTSSEAECYYTLLQGGRKWVKSWVFEGMNPLKVPLVSLNKALLNHYFWRGGG